jgi:hypothetical protein
MEYMSKRNQENISGLEFLRSRIFFYHYVPGIY